MNKRYASNSSNSVQKIALIAVLVAIGVIMSVVDKMISSVAFPFLPMAKIGLANIIIIFAVYRFSFLDGFLMVTLKSCIVGLILGGLMSFFIGYTGSLLSYFAMYLSHKYLSEKVSQVGVSVIGGFFHIVGQLLVIYFVYKLQSELVLYGSMLILLSLITSIIVGYISKKTIFILDNYK